jgi:hypothetical protein
MNPHPTITSLRNELELAAAGEDWGIQMIAAMRLLLHEDLTWDDLLRMLPRPECISVGPVAILHILLKKPRDGRNVVHDPEVWTRALAEQGLSPDDRVSEWISLNSDLCGPWQNFSTAISNGLRKPKGNR